MLKKGVENQLFKFFCLNVGKLIFWRKCLKKKLKIS